MTCYHYSSYIYIRGSSKLIPLMNAGQEDLRIAVSAVSAITLSQELLPESDTDGFIYISHRISDTKLRIVNMN